METKSLLYGIVGFILGGLLVSVAATTFDKPQADMSRTVSSLEAKKGADFDKAFVSEMIMHHESAVEMAKLSSRNAEHDEIKLLSENIISAQNKEISEMKQWQKTRGYSVDSGPSH